MSFNFRKLTEIVLKYDLNCFNFLQENYIVTKTLNCSICNDPMKIVIKGPNSVYFRCSKKDVVRLHHPAATDTEIAVLIKYWLRHAKERKDRLMKKAAEEAVE